MSNKLQMNALQSHILSSFAFALIHSLTGRSLESIYKLIFKGNDTHKQADELLNDYFYSSDAPIPISHRQRVKIIEVFQSIEAGDQDSILKLTSIVKDSKAMDHSFTIARRYLLEKRESRVRGAEPFGDNESIQLEICFSVANSVLKNVNSIEENSFIPSSTDLLENERWDGLHILKYGENNLYEETSVLESDVCNASVRYLQVDVSECVKHEERFPLLVRIIHRNISRKGAKLKPFSIAPSGTDVSIIVNSFDLSIVSSSIQMIRVPYNGDSEPLFFQLEAKKAGVHQVEILAFNKDAFLGSYKVRISVGGRQTEPPVRHSSQIDDRPPEEGEMNLVVLFDERENRYKYYLHGNPFGLYYDDDMLSGPLAKPRQKFVKDFVDTLDRISRGSYEYSSAAAQTLLKGKGKDLWKQLIPPNLERLLSENRRSIKQLRIICDQDPIPWEVLYPLYDKGFLAEQFPISRWRQGPHPPSKLSISDPLFVLPTNSPERSEIEVASLQLKLSKGRIIKELDPLLSELEEPKFNLLHFACHNRFIDDNPRASNIMMTESPFVPDFVIGVGKTLSQQAPLIFMNACRTAGTAPTYTQFSGWADTFLDAGAAAFIGTLWAVRDNSAQKFAMCVYESLLANATLGESVLKARRAIYDKSGDPTWLAYTLYGHPNATLYSEDK